MSKLYKVYIVSMLNQKDRRVFISNQLENLDIEYVFFDAINVSVDPEYLSYVDLNKTYQINGRELSKGEIGCSLSHYFIYKDIVENSIHYALVLEDDAILNKNLKKFIEGEILESKEWDVILLGYSKVSKNEYSKVNCFNPIGKLIYNKETKVGRVAKNTTCGTVGYLISLSGANKLLELKVSGNTVADNWPYFEKNGNLKIFHCRPFLVFEDFLNLESSIENERLVSNKIQYGNNKLKNLLKYIRGWFRLLFLLLKR